MIQLTDSEKELMLLCKGQLEDEYPSMRSWSETLKPWFLKHYGWDPNDDGNYNDYLRGMFNRLLDLYLKVDIDESGDNRKLKDIFNSSFYPKIYEDSKLPIERAISKTCALICWTVVVDKDGNERFSNLR